MRDTIINKLTQVNDALKGYFPIKASELIVAKCDSVECGASEESIYEMYVESIPEDKLDIINYRVDRLLNALNDEIYMGELVEWYREQGAAPEYLDLIINKFRSKLSA